MAIKKLKYPKLTFVVLTLLMTFLIITIQSSGMPVRIDQSARYPLTNLQKNTLRSMIFDDIESYISNSTSAFSPEEFGISNYIDVRDIAVAYDRNEFAADELYNGKTLAIRGTIQEISKKLWGTAVIKLSTHNRFVGATAFMRHGETSNVVSMHKGKSILLVCRANGVFMGAPEFRGCQTLRPYLERHYFKRVNKFLRGFSKNDKDMIILISYSLYLASKLPEETACNDEASQACFQDIDKLIKKIPAISSNNQDYMAGMYALNEAGVMSKASLNEFKEKVR